MMPAAMKKFALSFENLNRDNPHGALVEVVAQKEADARALTAKHNIDHVPDRNVWLDPEKTPCTKTRHTKQKTPGVLNVTTY